MTGDSRDPADPTNVQGYTPAKVYLQGRPTLFVANYRVLGSGWVSCMRWDRTWVKFPPHKVQRVAHVRKEAYGERNEFHDPLPERIADEDLREEARRLAQPTEVEAGDEREAIADGGEE